jgi:hypothetical protein
MHRSGRATAGIDVTRAERTQYCCRGCRDVDGVLADVEGVDAAIVDDDLRSVEPMFDLTARGPPRPAEHRLGVLLQRHCHPRRVAGLLDPFAAAAMGASSLLVVGHSSRSLVDGTPE